MSRIAARIHRRQCMSGIAAQTHRRQRMSGIAAWARRRQRSSCTRAAFSQHGVSSPGERLLDAFDILAVEYGDHIVSAALM